MKRHTLFSGLAWRERDGNTEPNHEVRQKYNEAWEAYLKEIPKPRQAAKGERQDEK